MTDTVREMQQVLDEADCLRTEAEVELALDKMATDISNRLQQSNPLIFCVMNGGLIITGKLLPKLTFPLEAHYLHATRYRHETSGVILDWKV